MSKLTATSILRQFKNFDKGRILEKSITVSQIKLFKNVGSHSNSSSSTQPYAGNKDDEQKTKKVLKSVGWFGLKTAVATCTVVGGITITVSGLGFTAAGVAAGSLAAAYQSLVLGGVVPAGSFFATLQSIGAAGLAASTKAGIFAGSAAATSAHTWAKKFRKK